MQHRFYLLRGKKGGGKGTMSMGENLDIGTTCMRRARAWDEVKGYIHSHSNLVALDIAKRHSPNASKFLAIIEHKCHRYERAYYSALQYLETNY